MLFEIRLDYMVRSMLILSYLIQHNLRYHKRTSKTYAYMFVKEAYRA
jgi:hypothetical protein